MNDRSPRSSSRRTWTIALLILAGAAVVTIAITALLVNIMERKQEARNPFYRVVDLDDETTDPSVWGKNFPIQYDQYRRTVDQVRTRYGGSEALPRTPDDADPRSIVAQSRLEEDPRLPIMWAGYPFAEDFREERGHAYMLEDQIYTRRQLVAQQPGACLHCHASVYVPYKTAGDGDLFAGFERLNRMPYQEAVQFVEHPVACIDCHHPETMQLRITRPAFIEGIRKVKALAGTDDYDVNTMASRQEMRSFVCGQCHVEYYFQGDEKRLTYPWDKGLRADQILAYFEETGFADWQHEMTGAPVLKAQHPEFEMWNQGIHARSSVACADCHMPYMRTGALKVSDHHVRSPLLNINNACQTCHNWPEQEIMNRVHVIQDRSYEMRNRAIDALVDLIRDIEQARADGVPDEMLAAARTYQRRGQFLADFVEAENSMGFHAPQETARVLTLSIDFSRKGQIALRDRATDAEPFTTVTDRIEPPPVPQQPRR
jgi:nitrite reductase (cytochrome c-552)